MPPQTFDSDSESEPVNRKVPADVEMEDDIEEEGEGDGEETGEDEYVVEAIKDHRFEGKTLMLLVKWKGYEKKSDMTWEPEENCEGAKEVLDEYFESIGGKPQYAAPTNKRSRPSVGTPGTAKKKKTTPSNDSPAPTEEPKWKPPPGSWEEEIQAIDTLEKTEKGLICYLQWANGRKSQHEVHTVYKKAPQRMLKFYEQHLVFKETGTNNIYKEDE